MKKKTLMNRTFYEENSTPYECRLFDNMYPEIRFIKIFKIMQNTNTNIAAPEIDSDPQDPGGFSCVFINGESFSDKEETYSEILKHTYEYKPELYEHVVRYLDY